MKVGARVLAPGEGYVSRHCEEPKATRQSKAATLDCFAALAMTKRVRAAELGLGDGFIGLGGPANGGGVGRHCATAFAFLPTKSSSSFRAWIVASISAAVI